MRVNQAKSSKTEGCDLDTSSMVAARVPRWIPELFAQSHLKGLPVGHSRCVPIPQHEVVARLPEQGVNRDGHVRRYDYAARAERLFLLCALGTRRILVAGETHTHVSKDHLRMTPA